MLFFFSSHPDFRNQIFGFNKHVSGYESKKIFFCYHLDGSSYPLRSKIIRVISL